MKTKTNKEIIKEFRKEFRPEYTGGGSIKNIIAYGKKLKSVKVDLSDVESFILQALNQKEREVIEKIKKLLPKELGFDDYGKHIHIYVNENSGKCGICGLSWKTASDYAYYNNAIIQVKKVLSNLKSEGK